MTREEAIERIKSRYDKWALGDKDLEAIQCTFHELTESEDEKIIEGFYTLIRGIRRDGGLTLNKVPLDKCDAWLEKQKESLHIQETCKEKSDSFTDGIIEVRSFQRGMEEGRRLEKQKEQKPFNVCEQCPYYKDCTDYNEKKQEWSEEDKGLIDLAVEAVEEFYNERNPIRSKIINFLKSLRPSWKPSEDEERLINTSISFLKDFADKGYENAVECIDWLKSKLNGNTGK